MRVHLAGIPSRKDISSLYPAARGLWKEGEDMRLCLAGNAPWAELGIYDEAIEHYRPYILDSFYYVEALKKKIPSCFRDFMLDSGAFTFMSSSSRADLDWEAYIERYAAFIRRYDIKHYLELDIDSIVGYEKVLDYRKKLEALVGRPCIPVWHKSRGIAEYLQSCEEYPYVAIGGIVTKEIPLSKYGALPHLIAEAHKRGAQVHGLGFTNLTWLPKCHFDSVDSTAWTAGNRFGYVYHFDGRTMQKIDVPPGKRIETGAAKRLAVHNYVEWLKFQQYAEKNL